MFKSILGYFSKFEIILWCSSVLLITISFMLFDRGNFLVLTASFIGATALIFLAKGNLIGQILTVLFSILYGIISFSFSYYGEMITYLGMTAPMAIIALISWLRNPYGENKSEVKVNSITSREVTFMFFIAIVVTVVFYFILKAFNTSNLVASTFSVTTSFTAVYLSYRISPYYAVAYALNDVILIVMWTLASFTDVSYISVVVCFVMFLFNDIYGFVNWSKMKKRQLKNSD